MTKINGKVIEEAVEVADSERGLGSTQSLKRMMDAGERRFWAKRGLTPFSWKMRDAICAGALGGASEKRRAADLNGLES